MFAYYLVNFGGILKRLFPVRYAVYVAVFALAAAVAVVGAITTKKFRDRINYLAAQTESLAIQLSSIASQNAAMQEQIAIAPGCDFTIKTLPFDISEPGRYCLDGNISTDSLTRDAIVIGADNVTIDGRGFTVTGPTDPATSARGILSIDRAGLTVKDAIISGFNTAILFGTTDKLIDDTTTYLSDRKSRDILVKGVRVDNATFQGIHVRADNFTIEGNTIAGIGPSTITPNASATGIYTRGNGCEISGNRIMLGDATGTGENVGIGADLGGGCRIERNTIAFDKLPEFGRNFGIWTKPSGGALPLIAFNLVSGAHHAYGPHGIFKDNVATNVVCDLWAKRPSTVDALHDLGGNIELDTNGTVRPGETTCYSDPDKAIARFSRAPTQNAAYSVALALGEADPVGREIETRAWLLVAACAGHSQASDEITKFPADRMTASAHEEADLIARRGAITCVEPGSQPHGSNAR